MANNSALDIEKTKQLIEHGQMRQALKIFISYSKKIREQTRYDLKYDFTDFEKALVESERFLSLSENLITDTSKK